jgi:hypothetical protein
MQDGTKGLKKVFPTVTATQLSPGAAVWMPVGTDIAYREPAAIGTIRIGTEPSAIPSLPADGEAWPSYVLPGPPAHPAAARMPHPLPWKRPARPQQESLTAAERLPPLTPHQACPQGHAAVQRPAGGLHGCRAADALARLGVVSGGTGWAHAVGGKGRLIFLYSHPRSPIGSAQSPGRGAAAAAAGPGSGRSCG